MTERYCIFPGWIGGDVELGRVTSETDKTFMVDVRDSYDASRWRKGTRKRKDAIWRVFDTLAEAEAAKTAAEETWKRFAKRVADARSLLNQAEVERMRAFAAAARGEPQ